MERGPDVAVGAVVIAEVATPLEGGRRRGVVLVRRKNPPSVGRWTLPGGRVKRGESLANAVAREVLEETGLAVEAGDLVEVFEVVEGAYHYVILDYLAHLRGPIEALKADDDALDAALVPLGKLADYGITDAVGRVITRALSMTAACAARDDEA